MPRVADQALYRIGQSVFSISTQGVLPWGLAAGKPAIAFGFEDRLEQQRNQRDPLELGAIGRVRIRQLLRICRRI